MISNFGNFLILTSIFSSILIIISALKSIRENNKLIPKNIFSYITLQSTTTFVCLVTLITAFIISDFSVSNVYQNSHSTKPLFYKISGAWGNHEGSLLLWINVLVFFSFFFFTFNKNSEKNYRLITLIIQNVLILGFLFFLILNSNPFSPIVPKPFEGLGLNPILQDPALAIHPPLLYVGFVGSSIYFSAAMSSLLAGYDGKSFAISIKPWVIISWAFQTLGIIIGSVWAYYELGWGGYWFWDPVENASLIPWFSMTALIHSIMVLEKRNTLYSWVILLCLMTFILSVTGTFLVRSGILNSVHTFANDPSRGLYILFFLTMMILSAFWVFFKKIKKEELYIKLQSKEAFILTNNWFMIFYLVTVLIGTLYPIFLEVISKNQISVGPPYYNTIIAPVLIPFLILMSIGPSVKWIKGNSIVVRRLLIIFFLAITINLLIFYFIEKYHILTNLVITSALFLILFTLSDLFQSLKNKLKYDFSRIISHLGFGMLIMFIGLNNSLSEDHDFNLKIGETKSLKNFSIRFDGVSLKEDSNFKSLIGDFDVLDIKKNSKFRLKPEIRIYNKPETVTYEASIKSNFAQDYFLTMSNINRSEFYNIKFQNKPLMLWIWISALMLPLGGILRIFRL